MRCQIAERKLSAYSDMELAEEQRVELEKHIQGCPACSEKLKLMEAAWADLGALPSEQLTPFFFTRLQTRLKMVSPLARFKDRVLVPLSFGVVILLGALTGSLVVSDNSQLTESAFAETSTTQDYIENHLQDFPEASFAQGYMDVAVISDARQGE